MVTTISCNKYGYNIEFEKEVLYESRGLVRLCMSFCFIGKQRFETALEQFSNKDDVELVFKSFELDPHAPQSAEHDVHDMLVDKYGMSREQAIAMNDNIGAEGRSAGIDFQFDSIQLTNTFDAHRLAKYASEQGKEKISQDLFKGYFTEGRRLGDHQTLIEMAVDAGLKKLRSAESLTGMTMPAKFVLMKRKHNEWA